MDLAIILGAETAGVEVTLDGVKYRTVRVDANGLINMRALSSATDSVKALQDTPDNLRVGVYGRIAGAWQRQPLAYGFSAAYHERVSNLNAAAGANSLATAAVPANTARKVTLITAFDSNNNPGGIVIFPSLSFFAFALRNAANLAGTWVVEWQGELWLAAGDGIQVNFANCTVNDDIYLDVHGVDMTLNL